MSILTEINTTNWTNSFSTDTKKQAIDAIEGGNIIHLPQLNFN